MLPSQPTIFSRLRRYRPSPLREAREDRLTEALAATFEAAPSAAAAVVSRWFDVEAPHELRVRTQQWTSAGDRVDLELLFGKPSRPSLRVWIEAKVDAVPERSQIERYIEALPSTPSARFVSWLLPAGVDVRGGTPVPIHTWAELAAELVKWRRLQQSVPTYGAGLVSEFIRHLEEYELASIETLGKVDAIAMSRYRTTLALVAELARQASEIIASKRGKALSQGTWPTPADLWESHMRGESWTENAFFEWSGRPDDAREEPQGEWVIGAGASWKLGAEPDEDDHRHWYAEARRQGFELGSGPHAIYLFRYLRLDELPGGETLSDQARGLAEWVLNTWDLLDGRPPVASAALPNPDHLVNDVVDEQGIPLPPGRTIDESDPPRQRPSDAPPLQT